MVDNFRALADQMKAEVDCEAQALTRPSDDVMPAIYTRRNNGHAFRIDIPTWWFHGRDSKEELIARCVALIKLGDVRVFGLRTTIWISEIPKGRLSEDEQRKLVETHTMPEHLPMPSKDPNRREYVGVHVFDAERYEIWHARIRRRRYGHPLLGEWELPGGSNAGQGLLVDEIVAALR